MDEMKANIKEAEKLMGKKIQNEFGSCFDSAAHQSKNFNDDKDVFDLMICHGIGVANMPGQEGTPIAHSWLEFSIKNDKRRFAYDPIWNVFIPNQDFREILKLNYVVEYNYKSFIQKWKLEGYPGPWDKKIKNVLE